MQALNETMKWRRMYIKRTFVKCQPCINWEKRCVGKKQSKRDMSMGDDNGLLGLISQRYHAIEVL